MINYFNLAAVTEKVTEAVTDEVQTVVEESFNLMKTLKELFLAYGMDIIIGIMIFLVGLYIASYVRNLSKRIMRKSNVDPSAIGFISQILYFLLLIIVAIAALGRIGVPTNSFVAAIGALGLAIGLALQNNLSNFASGILILIFKPFKVGDFIEAAGVSGSVNEIQIMNTILYFLEIVGISLFVSLAISGFVNYFGYRKSYENFGALSEQIFEKLGFDDPKEQDFYNDYLINDGINISVMDYRKNLKGQDPYPEDYFYKKSAVETLN